MEQLVIEYLKKTGLPIAEEYCRKLIASHPDYPAIISVADTFEKLGIDYAVGRKDEKGLAEISYPYLIHVNPFNLIPIDNEEDLKKNEDYLKHDWSGIIIKVDENQTPKSEAHQKAYQKERDQKRGNWTIAIVAVLALSLPIAASITLASALWMLTAIAGLAIGFVLVRKDLGIAGSKVEEFCRSGKNSDCSEVLESSAATLWKGIKLTDMVMGYFSFQLVVVLFSSFMPASTGLLLNMGLISLVALPMIFYSYYYQGVVTKKWCKLCLLVTAVLIAQGGMSFFIYPEIGTLSFAFEPATLGYMGILFILTMGLGVFFKRQYKETTDMELDNILSMRIVKSPTVFGSLLSKEAPVTPLQLSHNIILGNPEAKHSLYATLNMNCDPCRKAYDKLYETLQEQGDKFKVVVAFAPGNRRTDAFTDGEYFIQYWLENVQGHADENARTTELLKEWYDKMEAVPFRKKYALKTNELSVEAKRVADDQAVWLSYNGVDRSPTLFFNQRRMPMTYRMDMLAPAMQYILEELPVPQVVPQQAV